jgi:hypothetical protein
MYDTCLKSGSTRKVRRLQHKFQKVTVPHETTHRSANKLRQDRFITVPKRNKKTQIKMLGA